MSAMTEYKIGVGTILQNLIPVIIIAALIVIGLWFAPAKMINGFNVFGTCLLYTSQSHNPMKYYNIKQMVLPDYTMGTEYAMLNKLRTSIRETEVAACQAFHDGKKYIRTDIIEELNRLSSALHIMMCRHLAGWYSEDGGNE